MTSEPPRKPPLPREGWDDVDKRDTEARRISGRTNVEAPEPMEMYGGPPPQNVVRPMYGGPMPFGGASLGGARRSPARVIVAVMIALAITAAIFFAVFSWARTAGGAP